MSNTIHCMLGLVGTNGSGKSTVCDMLKSVGFSIVSLSDYVRQEVRRRELTQTRDHLVKVANLLKLERGQAVLAEMAFDHITNKGMRLVAFDSVRNLAEIAYLKLRGVVFLGIDSDIETRYERIQMRMRESDLIDFETFKEHDLRENTGVSSGQNIFAALEECDVKIKNNGSLADLQIEIDQLLNNPLLGGVVGHVSINA